MKKVLCGLVIALMMTGNGYAQRSIWDQAESEANNKEKYCTFLYKHAVFNIKDTYFLSDKASSLQQKILYGGLNNKESSELEKERRKYIKQENEEIKNAHHYANTWSAMCKD